MFQSKKRGLRSFRNTVILLFIVLFLPLVLVVIAKTFFVAPPIFQDYDKWVKEKVKGENNGFIYFRGVETLADRMFCGYFEPITMKTYRSDVPGAFVYRNGVFEIEQWQSIEFFNLYRFLVRNNLFREEIGRYTFRKSPTSKPDDLIHRNCIYPEKEWVSDFIRNSKGILTNIKKVNSKKYFLPLLDTPYNRFSGLSMNLLLIEMTNILISLQKEDYEYAMDWINSMNTMALRLEPLCMFGISPIGQQLSVIDIIATSPFIPDIFYQDLLCELERVKKELNELEFNTVFQYRLFYLEDAFIKMKDRLFHPNIFVSGSNILSSFFAYNKVSRALDEQRGIFESATWKDMEDAIFYDSGKASIALHNLQSRLQNLSDDVNLIWEFKTGTVYRNMVIYHNFSLSAVYSAIITVLLERYFNQHGTYPTDGENLLKGYFTEDEIARIEDYLDIFISPERYYIDYYPIPRERQEKHGTSIFKQRNIYRYRINY